MEKKSKFPWAANVLKSCIDRYLDGKTLSIDIHFTRNPGSGEIECNADATFSSGREGKRSPPEFRKDSPKT